MEEGVCVRAVVILTCECGRLFVDAFVGCVQRQEALEEEGALVSLQRRVETPDERGRYVKKLRDTPVCVCVWMCVCVCLYVCACVFVCVCVCM